jgi:hypothetical protein
MPATVGGPIAHRRLSARWGSTDSFRGFKNPFEIQGFENPLVHEPKNNSSMPLRALKVVYLHCQARGLNAMTPGVDPIINIFLA